MDQAHKEVDRVRVYRGALLVVCMVALAACGGNAQPSIITAAPTLTFTAVLTPTETAASAAVAASNMTATPMPTRLPVTATPGPSPTSPLRPTLSPAPITRTPTGAATQSRVQIQYFTTDSEFVKPGDNVTLFWSVRGADNARIFRVDEAGERIFRWDVSAAGQITVSTRESDREVVRFLLAAEVAGIEVEQLLLIPMQCPQVWFFEPVPDSCPAEPPQLSVQVEQTFEHGRMLWVGTLDRIYVVFEDGGSPGWAQYPDEYEEGQPASDDTLIPPPNLLQPVRGFGLVWRSNPRVQERLGWAISPEVSFEGMYQADSVEAGIASLYLRTRDGGIFALDAQTNDWEYLPPLGANEDLGS
jgi:hypothetical protein